MFLIILSFNFSNASNPSRDGESLYQTFNAPFYPFFIDPISGIRLLLYTSNNMGNGSLTMSIYRASSLGTPNGAQIGSTSNSWNATFTPTNTLGTWVNFNWTSLANPPILNGSSPYGYCFVVNFISPGTWNSSQSFYISYSTPASPVNNIVLTLQKGVFAPSNSSRRADYNITSSLTD